jgi:NIMA (never in mitosis gene a)-related kinase
MKEIWIGEDGAGNNNALIEAKILSKIWHQNIVKYQDNFMENGKLYLIMEYCEKGDLS